MSYQGICRYGRASDAGQSSGQRSLGPSRAAATWHQQMRLTATHRGADVITGEVGRLPAFTPPVSIAGAVVVAVKMVPSFESAAGQPGLGPGFVLAEGAKTRHRSRCLPTATGYAPQPAVPSPPPQPSTTDPQRYLERERL